MSCKSFLNFVALLLTIHFLWSVQLFAAIGAVFAPKAMLGRQQSPAMGAMPRDHRIDHVSKHADAGYYEKDGRQGAVRFGKRKPKQRTDQSDGQKDKANVSDFLHIVSFSSFSKGLNTAPLLLRNITLPSALARRSRPRSRVVHRLRQRVLPRVRVQLLPYRRQSRQAYSSGRYRSFP